MKWIIIYGIVWAWTLPAYGLKDTIFDFVSFRDVREIDGGSFGPYGWTCSRDKFDVYREPRSEELPNQVRAAQEALSPIRINSKEVLPSTESTTLHIYNNPGIRNGYSVAYGFQRNKECLHGEDTDCIVGPDFGRIRAVVVNAERFKEGQNLNFIKDHFMIEEEERFATIINAGSLAERKFYEAVFLGGYPLTEDSTRSSHQIDGKSYPMEIYMYFMDESVPAIPLTTVLVVLVEESDRDNPHVKPLVSTVLNDLYNKERRFIVQNKLLTRRAKLFHHLPESNRFDIHDIEQRNASGIHIVQDTITSSIYNEQGFVGYLEGFEKMQDLLARLYFIDEDRKQVISESSVEEDAVYFYRAQLPLDYLPFHIAEVHAFTRVCLERYERVGPLYKFPTVKTACEHILTNEDESYTPNDDAVPLPAPNTPHFHRSVELCTQTCTLFLRVMAWHDENEDPDHIHELNYMDKLKSMVRYIELDKELEVVHKALLDHFEGTEKFEDEAQHWPSENQVNLHNYRKDKFIESMVSFEFARKRIKVFGRKWGKLKAEVEEIVKRYDFPDEESMREVIKYLRFGHRTRGIKYRRNFIKQAYRKSYLPSDHKKRGPLELGNMEMSEEDIQLESRLTPLKSIVNQAFQISWLIPSGGGYYYYHGSSPVPPCFRMQNMVVFKTPIKMSRRQIEALTRIPVDFNKYHDIRSTHPRIHDPFFITSLFVNVLYPPRNEEVLIKIYEEKRNHLFLGHDGVHKNAVEEDERRRKPKAGGTMITAPVGYLIMMMIVDCLFLL